MPFKSAVKTRNKSGEVGAPSALPETGSLPVTRDVIAAVDHEIAKGLSVPETLVEVRDEIVKKFRAVNPTLSLLNDDVIRVKIKRLHEKAVKLKRKKFVGNIAAAFKEKIDRLFDIIKCQ